MFRPSGATSFDTGRSLRSGRRAGAGPRVVLRGKHFTHHGLDHHPITGARPRPAPRHQLGMPLRLLWRATRVTTASSRRRPSASVTLRAADRLAGTRSADQV